MISFIAYEKEGFNSLIFQKKYFFKKANQLASPGVSFICVNFQFFMRLITYHFARQNEEKRLQSEISYSYKFASR